MISILFALALVADPLPPPQPTPLKAPAVIVNPDLTRRPTASEIAKAYPRVARMAGQAGSARIACEVAVDGRLTPCRVTEESPPGWGFGKAALKIADVMRARPRLVNGVPTGGAIFYQLIRFVP